VAGAEVNAHEIDAFKLTVTFNQLKNGSSFKNMEGKKKLSMPP
jgi:hypothetical protein